MIRPGPLSLRVSNAGDDELRSVFGNGLRVFQRKMQMEDLARANVGIASESREELADCDGTADWGGVARMLWRSSPYPHAVGSRLFMPLLADIWLAHLEGITNWRCASAGFYSVDAIGIDPGVCGPDLMALVQEPGERQLETAASELFGIPLKLHGPLVAHRMGLDHFVGIHSDAPATGEETHRIVIFLARNPKPDHGGHFLLLDEPVLRGARRLLPLFHNSGVAFVLESGSYHAVTSVVKGERFSLILSFKPAVN